MKPRPPLAELSLRTERRAGGRFHWFRAYLQRYPEGPTWKLYRRLRELPADRPIVIGDYYGTMAIVRCTVHADCTREDAAHALRDARKYLREGRSINLLQYPPGTP